MSQMSKRSSKRPSRAQRRAQSLRDRSRNSLSRESFIGAGFEPPRAASAPPRRQRQARTSNTISSVPTAFNVSTGVNDQSVADGKRLAPNAYGVGTTFPFSTKLCDLSTNAIGANFNYQVPIIAATLSNTSGEDGFVTADTKNISGTKIHPVMLGSRCNAEAVNWTHYKINRLVIEYRPYVGTSSPGVILVGFTRDPTAFIEADGTQASPTVSYANLTQVVPRMSTNVYVPAEMEIKGFPSYQACELFAGTHTNDYNYLSYVRNAYAGRIAILCSGAFTGNFAFGQVFLHGVLEFRGPKYTSLSTGTLSQLAGTFRNSHIHLKGEEEKKQADEHKHDTSVEVLSPTLDSDGDWVMGAPRLMRKLKTKG